MRPVPGPPLRVWIALVPSAWVIGVLLFFLLEVILFVASGDPFVSLVVAMACGVLGLFLISGTKDGFGLSCQGRHFLGRSRRYILLVTLPYM